MTTQAANPVSKTTATLNGTVDPHGGEVSNCHFNYGLTNGYGQTAACVPAHPSGVGPVAVSAEITGLTASSGYHFQLVATNAGGSNSGLDEEFTTTALSKPSVTNDASGTITQTSIVLKGHVNNNGVSGGATCHFQIALPPRRGHLRRTGLLDQPGHRLDQHRGRSDGLLRPLRQHQIRLPRRR